MVGKDRLPRNFRSFFRSRESEAGLVGRVVVDAVGGRGVADGAHSLLSPDADGVELVGEVGGRAGEVAGEVEAGDDAGGAGEVLQAAGRAARLGAARELGHYRNIQRGTISL